MAYSIHHRSSAVRRRHLSVTTAAVAVTGENCSIMNGSTVSLKRKSPSPISSPTEPSPKRVTLNSPPSSSTTTAIAATKDGPAAISPSPAFSPFSKRVSEESPFTMSTTAAIAAVEDGPAAISQITSPSPAFSPFSKRASEKSPFSTTNAAAAAADDGPSPITSPSPAFSPFSKGASDKSPFSTTTADATAAPPLPFSRFTKMQPSNNNKILRRTLSEPPVFESFSAFCRYMKYPQSPENSKNNSISVKSPLRRSISHPSTAADIILAPATAAATLASKPFIGSEETTRIKKS